MNTDKISGHPASPTRGRTIPWASFYDTLVGVVSLGQAKPTMGYCQAWLGVRIDKGHYGKSDLSGLNIAMMP